MSQTTPKTPKFGSRHKAWSSHERRLVRQDEALARKAERANRSNVEQLKRLAFRGVTHGREFDRLTALIADERRKKFKKGDK